MQTTQALAVLAQVSVAFAGFSAIVTAFGKRTPEQWRPLDRLRFRFMIEFSLFTLSLSLAPLFVLAFGIAEAAVWRSCSGLLAVGALFYMLLSAHRVRRFVGGGVPMSRGFVMFARLLLSGSPSHLLSSSSEPDEADAHPATDR